MQRKLVPAVAGTALAALALPASAMADSLDAANNGVLGDSVPINTLWVVMSAVLVLFMLVPLVRDLKRRHAEWSQEVLHGVDAP